MKVRYADPAADDLDEAITYFRDNVPSLVLEFATSIDDAVAQIADNPYLAQETENPSLRRWYIPRFRYSVFYTVAEEEVVILHIRHAARRWPWERDADNHLD
jgi:plasmid stabilization system protein ParE